MDGDDRKIVGCLAAGASLIAILSFLTGRHSLPDFFAGSSAAPATERVEAARPSRQPYQIKDPTSPSQGTSLSNSRGSGHRVPFLGNDEAPSVTEPTTFSLMPGVRTGCLKVPQDFTFLDINGLPPVPVRIFVQCTNSNDGIAILRYSRFEPTTARFVNPSQTEIGFISIAPK